MYSVDRTLSQHLLVCIINVNDNPANTRCDTIIIGGGLLGSAIAVGLAKRDHNVTVLDGGDGDLRASRGNFGLTWVQGKGANSASYAQWTGSAVRCWPDFADELKVQTGIDIELQQIGGLDYCLSEAEWRKRADTMQRVKQHTHGQFEFEMLDNQALRALVPEVSTQVFGASFSPQDGHLNPLKLLRALHVYMQQMGCSYRPNVGVLDVKTTSSGFAVKTQLGTVHCEKLVFCAGLANTELAAKIELSIPLKANQGQLLITERVPPFLKYPSIHIRQTDEGTLQIGDSHAEIGLNDNTKLSVIADIAARLTIIFPHLRSVNVLRSWSALRVMTPDGLPIYERALSMPNAFVINCHSGVTLAAQHASTIANWISDPTAQDIDELIGDFSSNRFNVSNYSLH